MKDEFSASPRLHVSASYFGEGYYQLYRRYLLPREQTRAETAFLLGQLQPRRGQRWLDLPCGYGRHLRELHERRPGLRLSGGDLNFKYLHEPGLRRAAKVTVCDMRRLPFAAGVFHGILNLLNSYGYYPPERKKPGVGRRPADDVDVLREWARVLRPRGRLVLDLPNRQALVELVRRQPRIRYCGGPYEVTEEFAWDAEREVLANRTVWQWPQGEERAAYRLRLYRPSQIKRLLQRQGFTITDMYGDFSGYTFDPYQSERMLIFAVKG